jgi:hypothetical protein
MSMPRVVEELLGTCCTPAARLVHAWSTPGQIEDSTI